jgi:hypothetical protein
MQTNRKISELRIWSRPNYFPMREIRLPFRELCFRLG